MKYAIASVSVEATRANMHLLDEMMCKLILAVLDRSYGQVCLKSSIENGVYSVIIFCTAISPKTSSKDSQRLLKHLANWNKLDPEFFIDFSVGGPMQVSPIEEFIEMLEAEHNTVILPEDLD